jgi:hypothetical protein
MSSTANIPIARAIKRLASEHGVPNSFSVSEIAHESGGSQLSVGKQLANELPNVAFHSGFTLERDERAGLVYIKVASTVTISNGVKS